MGGGGGGGLRAGRLCEVSRPLPAWGTSLPPPLSFPVCRLCRREDMRQKFALTRLKNYYRDVRTTGNQVTWVPEQPAGATGLLHDSTSFQVGGRAGRWMAGWMVEWMGGSLGEEQGSRSPSPLCFEGVLGYKAAVETWRALPRCLEQAGVQSDC